MKSVLILAFGALTLSACNGSSGKCDTADTAGCVGGDSGGGSGSVLIQEVISNNCGASSCKWEVLADGQIGTVELELIETGDTDRFESGCNEAVSSGSSGGLTCGVWSEYHNAFSLEDSNNEYGGDTKSLDLDIVGSFEDQQNNQSSLFDMSNSAISNQLTVKAGITDENGNYADCVTFGHNPNYYSECEQL